MGISIGPVIAPNRAFLAPMSGVTDAPMRALAHELGAGLVVSEMVASEELARARPKTLHRARNAGQGADLVIQLAGREARWMAEGARMAQDLGARIIDINMGCPAKQVTNGLSGSALMRDPDHALSLIEAVVGAVEVPVTLKMRLGWDDDTRNAPELAARAEQAGVRMITVHGRTRCQFFSGSADWTFIARVKQRVTIPVVANGDLTRLEDADCMLRQSGADAVMIGRGACGRPWFVGQVAHHLAGRVLPPPSLRERHLIVQRHYDAMLSHYGTALGVRCARKHLGWYVADTLAELGAATTDTVTSWRARLCREDEPARVRAAIDELFACAMESEAA